MNPQMSTTSLVTSRMWTTQCLLQDCNLEWTTQENLYQILNEHPLSLLSLSSHSLQQCPLLSLSEKLLANVVLMLLWEVDSLFMLFEIWITLLVKLGLPLLSNLPFIGLSWFKLKFYNTKALKKIFFSFLKFQIYLFIFEDFMLEFFYIPVDNPMDFNGDLAFIRWQTANGPCRACARVFSSLYLPHRKDRFSRESWSVRESAGWHFFCSLWNIIHINFGVKKSWVRLM